MRTIHNAKKNVFFSFSWCFYNLYWLYIWEVTAEKSKLRAYALLENTEPAEYICNLEG